MVHFRFGRMRLPDICESAFSALPGPYASPYVYVRTASQPVRSKNSFRISISVQ